MPPSRERGLLLLLVALSAVGFWNQSQAAEVKVEKSEAGATVTVDGEPFAEYRLKSGHQPVIWPIIGPGGQKMTRQYPLGKQLPTEQKDHPHHRSLWFNHGLVNGKDFWLEPGQKTEHDNQIEHREFAKLQSGKTGLIVTRNEWLSNGDKLCEDTRTIEFGADADGRWIDFKVEVAASEEDLIFGDTKEGAFGLRVPGTMDVDAKKGGEIVNSRGERDGKAWGRPAEWVDYHGIVEDKPAGIVIFDMPDSFRHPTKWHVRTYGLFAANPFGEKDFETGEPKQGEAKLAKGDTLKLHYRVLFYEGKRSPEEIGAMYKKYAKERGVAGGD